MLGVAGILAQEIVKPGVFFYNAGLPENLPNINFGGPDGKVMLSARATSQMLSCKVLEAPRCSAAHRAVFLECGASATPDLPDPS